MYIYLFESNEHIGGYSTCESEGRALVEWVKGVTYGTLLVDGFA